MIYRCDIALIRDEDGVSAIVLNLPGAASFGDTVEQALANATEAVRGVIEEYRSSDQPIPWTVDYEVPDDAQLRRILVNV